VKIHDGVGGNRGRWFVESVVRKVRNGVETFFWYDRWLGDVPFCVRFNRLFESAHHLFLNCSTFNSLWPLVRLWIGFSCVDSHVIPNHFIKLIHATCGLKARHSFLQLAWLLCVWMVWNERNNILFKNL